MAKGGGGSNNTPRQTPQQSPQGMGHHGWEQRQQFSSQQPPAQPPSQPQQQPSWMSSPFGQRIHNMQDWWGVMRGQSPTDYFASMYKAQQPAPATAPAQNPVSQPSPGLMSTMYNPNTGMPI